MKTKELIQYIATTRILFDNTASQKNLNKKN